MEPAEMIAAFVDGITLSPKGNQLDDVHATITFYPETSRDRVVRVLSLREAAQSWWRIEVVTDHEKDPNELLKDDVVFVTRKADLDAAVHILQPSTFHKLLVRIDFVAVVSVAGWKRIVSKFKYFCDGCGDLKRYLSCFPSNAGDHAAMIWYYGPNAPISGYWQDVDYAIQATKFDETFQKVKEQAAKYVDILHVMKVEKP